MARRCSRKSMKRQKCTYKNWESLEVDVLLKIFALVPVKDLFFRASRVCKWWQFVFRDMFFWKVFWKDAWTLDFGDLKVVIGGYSPHEGIKELKDDYFIDIKKNIRRHNMFEGRVFRGLNYVLNHDSCKDKLNFVSELILPPQLYLTDNHLIHLSKRLPNLKKLTLLGVEKIRYYGFTEASINWKKLEYLSLGPICNGQVIDMTASMGINCSNLKTLYLHCSDSAVSSRFTYRQQRSITLNSKSSKAISNLHQLQFLTIHGAALFKCALDIILTSCEQLTRLQLIECYKSCGRREYSPVTLSVDLQKNGVKWYVDGKQDKAYGVKEIIRYLNIER